MPSLITRGVGSVRSYGFGGSSGASNVRITYNPATFSINVPAYARPGDILVLVLTAGTNAPKSLPSGFTNVYSGEAAAIGYRAMQVGDLSFTFAHEYFAALVIIHKTSGHYTYDTNSAVGTPDTSSASVTLYSPTVTVNHAPEIALMIFANSFQSDPRPTDHYTNLIPAGVVGFSGSGMSISWTEVQNTGSFNGDTLPGIVASRLQAAIPATLLFY